MMVIPDREPPADLPPAPQPPWCVDSAAEAARLPDDDGLGRCSPDLSGDVLVVDDTAQNLLAIEAAFSDLPFRLVKAQSGAQALRRLLAQDFALILLDVQMPDMNGFETARLIRQRERSRYTPIIFVTAYHNDDAAVTEAYRLGAVDFLFKPLHPEILRAKASVFVALQRRTAQVAHQALELRRHERRAHARQLAEQRRQIEAEALQQHLAAQQQHNEELARKAEELARKAEELEHARQALEHMNRELVANDERKNDFLATLAHELRNPLAPIVTGLEILEHAVPASPELDRARGAMRRQTAHLVRLVDDLLDMSRITSGKIELRKTHTDVHEVLRQAVSISQPYLNERRHALTVDAPDGPVPVHGDCVRLTQVVSNLLNNAARYTDPGGAIRLCCTHTGQDAVITVTDSGRGIAPDLLQRIFDMFVQERTGGGGLGIGLTLARRIVEMHGGSISARSEGLGCGSDFEVRLPISRETAPVLDAGSDATQAASPSSAELHIVLVEDNEDVRTTLQQMLETWGHRVQTAGTSQEGRDLLLEARPDVAFIDIGLPDGLGYEVAHAVRQSLPDAPIRLIALTGFNQPKDQARARASGFDAHLAKPPDGAKLRALLTRD